MAASPSHRVLVTGGSGFIGTNLIEHFSSIGWPTLNLDWAPPRNPQHLGVSRAVDVSDVRGITAILREFRPTVVIHAAARTDLEGRSLADYRTNYDGVRSMITAMHECGSVQRALFFSSRLVCRIGYQPTSDVDYCPSTFYGESKVVGERHVRQLCDSIPWTIVRPTSIWGPWFDIPYRTFFDAIMSRRYVHIRGCSIPKSFGFVGNTIFETHQLVMCSLERVAGRTFYLADYPPIDLREFGEAVQRCSGAPPIRTVPGWLLRGAAVAGDLLKHAGWKSVPLTSFRLHNMTTPMIHDLRPLEAIVGPLPYSLEEGVAETVRWMVNGSSRSRA